MRIHIHARGFALTEALRIHGERRLLFALSRFGRQVLDVKMALGDLNGARGGIDKRCQVVGRRRQARVVPATRQTKERTQ